MQCLICSRTYYHEDERRCGICDLPLIDETANVYVQRSEISHVMVCVQRRYEARMALLALAPPKPRVIEDSLLELAGAFALRVAGGWLTTLRGELGQMGAGLVGSKVRNA